MANSILSKAVEASANVLVCLIALSRLCIVMGGNVNGCYKPLTTFTCSEILLHNKGQILEVEC